MKTAFESDKQAVQFFETTFQDQNAVLQIIFDTMADGVIVADRQARLAVFNRAAEQMHGLGRMNIPAEKWPERYGLYLPDQKTLFAAKNLPLARAIQGESVDDVEIFVRNSKRPKGLWMNVNARPIQDSHGTILGGVIVCRDITEHKKFEAERKHSEGIERKQALELARLNAEREYLELFAYVASHDLQEPLQKIMAFSDLLKISTQALDEKSHDYVERMEQAARRMSRMISDILQFTKVTTGNDLFGPVDLNQVIGEVLSDLDLKISLTQAKIETGKLPRLRADRRQVYQLFLNLITNALKFQKKGETPHLVIRERPSSVKGFAEIGVSDNGIGFDEKYLAQIFRPFERLHQREHYEGSGIGLAICKKIVARHGGVITAASREGEGATFWVTLPLEGQPKGNYEITR